MNKNLNDLLNLAGVARLVELSKTGAKNRAKVNFLRSAIIAGDKQTLREIEDALDLPQYQDYKNLIKHTEAELKENFTEQEFWAIYWANNPGNIDFQPSFLKFNSEPFVGGMKAVERLDSAFSRVEGVSWEEVQPKLEALTRLETYTLQLMIHKFWNNKNNNK